MPSLNTEHRGEKAAAAGDRVKALLEPLEGVCRYRERRGDESEQRGRPNQRPYEARLDQVAEHPAFRLGPHNRESVRDEAPRDADRQLDQRVGRVESAG